MFQIFPGDKVPASEATEFRVLYDKANLYVGIWSFHKNIQEITANAGNEASAFDDDWVGIVLDTFHDKRNSYVFLVTPNSLRVEMLSSDNGRNQNHNWETVWTARCGIHDWGWGAELAKICNKPLHVFDQGEAGWFKWTQTQWEKCTDDNIPVIQHKYFTGTGTRYLEESGKQAISELFDRSFG